MKSSTLKRLGRASLLACAYAITLILLYQAYTHGAAADDSRYTVLRGLCLILLLPAFLKILLQLTGALMHLYTRGRRRVLARTPRVSILIPAYNEEIGILRTLNSALEIDYPDVEIIVINDGSTDGTHERIEYFLHSEAVRQAAHASIRYLRLDNGGKARALNRALKMSSGEYVVTLDADSVIAPDAVRTMLLSFDNPKVAGVAGNVIVGNQRKTIEWVQQLEYLYGFFFKRSDSLFNSVYIIGGAAAAYRKSALDEVGGFDPSIITEDIELSTRLLAHGYYTRYAPEALVHTEGPSDFKSLCAQRLRWKYGRLLTFLKHRKLFFKAARSPNPYLTWMLLPVALYMECLLLLEGLFLALMTVYTVSTGDYVPIVFGIGLVTTIVCGQIAVEKRTNFHKPLYLIAPIAWMVFLVVDFIEFQALLRALRKLVKREDLHWQKWTRIGLLDSRLTSIRKQSL
ncbi:glycosyltransferase [Coraliomargarita akajimensis]|uniref:Glycosyl transferase family 2 n=1 Tax=Coraliomargarita akajimensis (strain DSM 45221 / IAM 15411 / JCM 23193 / KCTC 12865 / 04OKA010-24) TaxID=583355 RepID=D5ER48_CORAD|nr:glycosyltransferase [Coraliomargarita akajimensis]ADE55892.1 glycosyl transferase family 2 [Coraliomargarita akajimensis DSM 45221]